MYGLPLYYLILKHNALYHTVGCTPEISDAEYDALVTLYTAQYNVDPSLPPLPVGSPVTANAVSYYPPMLSLDAVYGMTQLLQKRNKVFADHALVIQPKVDGVALRLVYVNSKLVVATTRGDGSTGQNVLHVVKAIDSIPKMLGAPGIDVEVRGELVMTRSTLELFNGRYKNARNAVSGILNSKTAHGVTECNLLFLAYDALLPQDTHTQRLAYLKSLNFGVVDYYASKLHTLEQNLRLINREHYPYDIDGVVIKIDSIKTCDTLGVTDRVPRWAIALKYIATENITRVSGFTFSVGRTGYITPVVHYQPVNVGNAVLTKATLHNARYLKELKIGVGSKISIIRAGDVIPTIQAVIDTPSTVTLVTVPEHCPECGAATVIMAGIEAQCTNLDRCKGVLIAKLTHFVSDNGVKFKGFGPRTIRRLVESGEVKTWVDLFKLDANFKPYVKTRDSVMKQPIHRLYMGLGLPGLGKAGCKALAKIYPTIEHAINCTGGRFTEHINELREYAALLHASRA